MSELKISILVVFEQSFRESFNIPEQKRKKRKISPIVIDRELLSQLKKERDQIIKSNVKESGGQKDQRVCIIKSTTLKT